MESGDRSLVKTFPQGVLLAVVDGLGHGHEAAIAAQAAIATLEENAHESVVTLVERCHRDLRPTRGAVMSLAALSHTAEAVPEPGGPLVRPVAAQRALESSNGPQATMTWLGVGDVEGVLLRADRFAGKECLLSRGGVVGYQLPTLRLTRLPVGRGDLVIFTTDGIHGDFIEKVRAGDSPQQIADAILIRCNRGTDDALVLVARYVGPAP